ncbi:UBN2 domain-containing protein [Cephalotus follicularis]|uniref:UBN2 domain-containing protein n=1 Tax=Cephalotus follicularis TaxID=3775 RepID=A0A1Q3D6I3_CEPFO|nr:UBN2 domain-containing protein [Cephalotus follicularis]
MWNLLEVTYEGTNQVKESKISILVHQYELFMMHDDENISDMFPRFTTIINSLKNIGESKDLTTLPLEQLLGSLMTRKTAMMNHESEETKRRKLLHLKPQKTKMKIDDSSSDEESDGDVANITFLAIENEEENMVHLSTSLSFAVL